MAHLRYLKWQDKLRNSQKSDKACSSINLLGPFWKYKDPYKKMRTSKFQVNPFRETGDIQDNTKSLFGNYKNCLQWWRQLDNKGRCSLLLGAKSQFVLSRSRFIQSKNWLLLVNQCNSSQPVIGTNKQFSTNLMI